MIGRSIYAGKSGWSSGGWSSGGSSSKAFGGGGGFSGGGGSLAEAVQAEAGNFFTII
ncbi:MAG: hypothetical protein R2942_18530 [Ignavibacteria bacterium]